MSLSGSAQESDNKTNDGQLRFNQSEGPDPTPENPAGVHPDSIGGAATPGTMPGSGGPGHGGDVRGVFGNPLMFQQTFSDLSGAFTKAIQSVQDESGSGIGSVGKALIGKLEAMRAEIDGWRKGESLAEAGDGEQNDQVERAEGDGGGLYKD